MAMRLSKNNRRTFKWSAWLGWQMESNWARPFIFAIYSIIRPVATALILVIMFTVITILGGQDDPEKFHHLYIGNAFFMYIAQVLFGITWVIHDDREHFRTMKYIYISPANYFVYMLGRTLSKIVISGSRLSR